MTATQPRSPAPLLAALVTLAIHLIGNPHYGFFRDELYFIACGFHPAWGYVDQPPIVPLLSAATQLFGHSLFLLRAVAALFAAGGVYAACLLAIEFGGGSYAQWLTAAAVCFSPVLTSFGMKMSTETPGLLLWPLAALFVVRVLRGGDPRLWLAAGATFGLGMESKYNIALFAIALVAGIRLSPSRRALRSPWFAAGFAIAALIALPSLLWQAAYGFPMIELLRHGQVERNVVAPPWLFVVQQVLITNPVIALVWIAGLAWTLYAPARRYLGYAYLILIALTCALHGKHYYVANVYPVLFAGGGTAIETWTRGARIVRTAFVSAIVAAGIVSLPFTLPVLGEQAMVNYSNALAGILPLRKDEIEMENLTIPPLLPDFSDMHGWPQLARDVAGVYRSLPPEQRARTAIFAHNYGEAGAIDFFGATYGLPHALSGNDNYYLWGTRGESGDVVIDVGGECWPALHWFGTARIAERFSAPWIMPQENGIPISVCTSPNADLGAMWPELKSYI